MTILKIIEDEFESKGMIKVPFLIDRLSISLGCHLMNLSNIDDKRFFHGGLLENFRIHIVVMAPSGFGKSMPFKFFLGEYGLLNETDIKTSVRGTFSRESWMGTVYSDKNKKDGKKKFKTKEGIFNKFKRGIIGADEFMRLKVLCDGEGIAHDEVYLMQALEHDTATKDLSYGSVEEKDIGTTVWAGMRIAPLNTTSGFARRWSYQVFFPTPSIAKKFKKAGRDKKMKKPISDVTRKKLNGEINTMRDVIDNTNVKTLDFSDVETFINGTMAIPHFEETIYKRLAIGYSIANGTFPDIILDDNLTNLIINEEWARYIIRESPEREMMYRVIENESGNITKIELFEFLKRYYQLENYRIKTHWRALISSGLVKKNKKGVLFAKALNRPKKYKITKKKKKGK